MRITILHCLFAVLCVVSSASGQDAALCGEPFAPRCWHFEVQTHAALEAWNYNASHEELYGLEEGITFGLSDGWVLTASQRVYYVSQRANDSWALGLTAGIRRRVYRHARTTAYVEAAVGVSDAAIAAPPRGTRFNYLAVAGGGVLVRARPRVDVVIGLQWVHLSNASLKGCARPFNYSTARVSSRGLGPLRRQRTIAPSSRSQ